MAIHLFVGTAALLSGRGGEAVLNSAVAQSDSLRLADNKNILGFSLRYDHGSLK